MKEKLLFASGVYHGRKVILQSKRFGRSSETLVIAKHGRELTPGIFIRHRQLKILKKPDDMPSPPWDPKFSANFVVRGDENLALKIIDPGVVGKFFELDKSDWTKSYTIAVNGRSKAGGEVVFEYGYFTSSKKLLRKAMDLVVDLAEKCEKT
ncbi:MAG: hypothetical protein QME47_07930 [Candidatus Thermoplasmatota archaeon]|nr:hypothetical protein [Candidatus Thermoplasmatota archaeon]